MTRDKAIKNLSVFLSDPSRDVVAKPDMDKLWKGIFYSLFCTLHFVQAFSNSEQASGCQTNH